MTDLENLPPASPPSSTEEPAKKNHLAGALPLEKSKQKDPLAMRLINTVAFLLIAYAMVSYFSGGNPLGILTGESKKADAPSAATQGEAQTASGVITTPHPDDPRIERFFQLDSTSSLHQLLPRMRKTVLTQTLKAGEGRGAFCGQTVTYHMLSPVSENTTGESKAGKPRTFRLGDINNHDAMALTYGLEGMRVGEIRELKIPKDFYGNTSFLNQTAQREELTTERVELLSVTPELPKMGTFPLRRFLERQEDSVVFRCGDQAFFHLTLWDGKGNILFSSLDGLPLYMEVGSGKGIPFGLEILASDMGMGGRYTAIIPKELVQPLYPNEKAEKPPAICEARLFPADVKLPTDQTLIANLQFLTEAPRKKAAKGDSITPPPACGRGQGGGCNK
jgi:hypothetical protein